MKIIALASLLFAAACVVEPPAPTPPGNGPDASLGGSPDAGGTPACVAPAPSPGDGHHNAGQNCLGCHTGASSIPPKWYAAGTLYDSSGTSPISGATITLVDSTGKTVKLVTADNGNFWTPEQLTPPLHPKASKCPSSAAMNGNATGACNSCHTSGGSPGRIKLQ